MSSQQYFGEQGPPLGETVSIDEYEEAERGTPAGSAARGDGPFPAPILEGIPEDRMKALKIHVEGWLTYLKSIHQQKIDQWTAEEAAYRAKSEGPRSTPFVGASGDVVPVVAMGVDPVHARLDTGIFKASPVFRFKALKKAILKHIDSLEQWVEFYQKHRLKLREVASPRLLEMTKHGTMIFKTVYESITHKRMGYGKDWKVEEKEVTMFKGPRIYGISIQDFLFPPGYQHLNDCPFVAQIIRPNYSDMLIAEQSGKLKNVKKLKGQERKEKDALRQEREISAGHEDNGTFQDPRFELYEIWCDFPLLDEDKPADRLILTYDEVTGEFLQIRYNWYFHQKKPFTLIPYQITNDSLYGMGLCEMQIFFQDSQTKWHRMAQDNAYLANIRMFIAKKESGIEEVPKLYTGRVFFVDNPQQDFMPFQAADIYPSTLQERQNIFGLSEKRTGISDYLTGRESPVIGSRATATSTVALIQEGTRRVEEVLENIRRGFSEMLEYCMYIWIQYGLDDVDDVVFGDDKIAEDIKDFFSQVDQDNIGGMLAIDLSATDAANNKSIQQQVQLAIIQVMMQYLNKLVEVGQLAIQAQQTMPVLAQMIGEVMKAARQMFLDLLTKYDIRNPEDYLPELERFLQGAAPAGGGLPPGGDLSGGGQPAFQPAVAPPIGATASPTAAFAARAGVGDPNAPITPATG